MNCIQSCEIKSKGRPGNEATVMDVTAKHQVTSLFPSFSATSSWKEPGNEATVMGEEKESNGRVRK